MSHSHNTRNHSSRLPVELKEIIVKLLYDPKSLADIRALPLAWRDTRVSVIRTIWEQRGIVIEQVTRRDGLLTLDDLISLFKTLDENLPAYIKDMHLYNGDGQLMKHGDLPNLLPRMIKLRTLTLGRLIVSEFTERKWNALTAAFRTLPSLTTLDLYDSQFPTLSIFVSLLVSMPHLAKLDIEELDIHPLRGEYGNQIPPPDKDIPSLRGVRIESGVPLVASVSQLRINACSATDLKLIDVMGTSANFFSQVRSLCLNAPDVSPSRNLERLRHLMNPSTDWSRNLQILDFEDYPMSESHPVCFYQRDTHCFISVSHL